MIDSLTTVSTPQPMKAALFNTIYAPLSVKFGSHLIALMPLHLALKAVNDLEENPDNQLAIALEHAIQRRYFVFLLDQNQPIAEFPCSKQQYDNKILPETIFEAVRTYLSVSDTSAHTSQ